MAKSIDTTQNVDNSKRNLMVGAAAVAALGVVNPVIAATDPHAAHKPAPAAMMLAKVALECESIGQECLAHIFQTFTSGDTSLAKCGIAVDDAIAACAATAKLALNNSAHLKAMAAVCKSVCTDCEAECRKHAKKHAICGEMADACKATVDACKKVIG